MAKANKKPASDLKLVESVNIYKMVPVDQETYDGLKVLIEKYGFPKRSQGVVVKKLVKAEMENIETEERLKSILNVGAAKAEPVTTE
jgi:hypothetical protein